ncbi:MAG: hypothetical protein RSP_22360 [Rhodanobacter sp.]
MDGWGAAIAKPTRRHTHLARVLALLVLCLPAVALAAPAATASVSTATSAPTNDAGLPFIRNFSPSDYGAAAQNWALAQDREGVIYVGNVEGYVLSFDGAHWQRIPVPNHATVRSLALGPDDRIYVGTVGDLGYLKPDGSGQLSFVSLRNALPPGERDFADVWSVFPTADGVYFVTINRLFRYRNGTMKVWKPSTTFHTSFMVEGRLYLREAGLGLLQLDGDRLALSPDGARFADEKIYALLPWRGPDAQPGDLLAGTRAHGWFIRHDGIWRPWSTEADAAIRKAQLYDATWLADGRLVALTIHAGLFVLDAQGHLLRTLNRSSGLATNSAIALMQGREHGLWVAEGSGVARIDMGSPLTHFGVRAGLPEDALLLQRHAGTLYVGATDGLYRLVTGTDPHVERVPKVAGPIWDFTEVGDQLLVACDDGVFAGTGDSFQPVRLVRRNALSSAALSLWHSTTDPARVFVGYPDGVGTLRHEGHRWIDEGLIAGVPLEVHSIRQDAAGNVWLSPWVGGAMRLSLPPAWQGPHDPRPVKVDRYGSAEGLSTERNDLVAIDGKLRFVTALGIYRFDAATSRFSPDPAFASLFPDGPQQIDDVHQNRDGSLWIYATVADGSKQIGHAVRDGRHWRWQPVPLQPLDGIGISDFLDDPDGTVWIAGDKGLFRYQSTRPVPVDARLRTLLRGVFGQDDRVPFAGNPAGTGAPEIPWNQNSIRFEFALPSYAHADTNRYQTWLQGLDRGWSPWREDAYREYTNLPDGLYRFHVRGRNLYGQEGREAVFDFRVLPPWYRTTWAWLLWAACGALALSLLVRWRSHALRQRNRALAMLVSRRTTELAQANEALREANAALAQQVFVDSLTGLKNRRYLDGHIEHDLANARRHGPELQMYLLFLIVDVDHFKQINDSHGHAAGDLVLQQFRDVLLSVVRESDTAVRYGGEEFLIVARFALPGTGPQYAERVRAAVAAHRFVLDGGQSLSLSCSLGFASYPLFTSAPDRLAWEQVVNIADECLYAAKRHGRNAWAGVLPAAAPPDAEVAEALREALARLPEPGPLPVAASWTCAKPPEAMK